MYQITAEDFFNLINEPFELSYASDTIMRSDMRYNILSKEEKEYKITEILKELDKNKFSTTGDLYKWSVGWGEVYDKYKKTKDVSDLSAIFSTTRGEQLICRLYGEYIQAYSHDFHRNMYTALHYWAIEKYFNDSIEIFDFGCGTGENIKHISDIYPNAKLHGMDWAQESVDIVNLLKQNLNINAYGHRFDMFMPELYSLDVPEGSAIYTSESLEQLGGKFEPFLNFLLEKKPSIVVHFEPILEFYNDEVLLDYLASKYHTQRKYLNGYYTELLNLHTKGKIEILKQTRLQYGGLNHDSSIVVWKPL